MHSVSNLGARKFGREDLPTIGFATRRILQGIEITSTRIRSSADWSSEQLNIVAALRFRLQAGCVGREGRDFSRALPEICANVSSYPAGRRGENITGGRDF